MAVIGNTPYFQTNPSDLPWTLDMKWGILGFVFVESLGLVESGTVPQCSTCFPTLTYRLSWPFVGFCFISIFQVLFSLSLSLALSFCLLYPMERFLFFVGLGSSHIRGQFCQFPVDRFSSKPNHWSIEYYVFLLVPRFWWWMIKFAG